MKILVTGGGGFIGLALIKRLVKEGHDVSSFSRKFYPEHRKLGITGICGDICDTEQVDKACRGKQVVYHVAAKVAVWGPFNEFVKVNIGGTENLVKACQANRVKAIIFVSSASVVFNGSNLEGVDESRMIPERHISPYTRTKAGAEEIVLSSNCKDLKTISLRPHLVWGPGDTQLIPGILARARKKALRIPGKGECMIDTTYIDNLVDALVLVLLKIETDSKIWGKSFFITDGKPVTVLTFLNNIIEAGDLPPVNKSVPVFVAMFAAWCMEKSNRFYRIQSEPYLTRFVVRELSVHHWFDITAAKNELGYTPHINLETGIALVKKDLRKD